MRARTLIAALTAPVVGILAGFAVLAITGDGFGDSSWIVWFLIVGAPIVYLLEAAIGIPLYRWMQSRNAVTATPVILAATGAGVLVLSIIFAFIGGALTSEAVGIAALLGGVGGLVTGVWFWLVSGWGRQPQPA